MRARVPGARLTMPGSPSQRDGVAGAGNARVAVSCSVL